MDKSFKKPATWLKLIPPDESMSLHQLAEEFFKTLEQYKSAQSNAVWPRHGLADELHLANGPEALNHRIPSDVPPTPPWAKEIVENAINGYLAGTKKPKE